MDTGILLKELIKESMKEERIAGLRFGRTTRKKAFTGGQPRVRAASSKLSSMSLRLAQMMRTQ